MFEVIIFALVCACGITMLVVKLLKPSAYVQDPQPWYLDWARSFFPVLLFVFLLRAFVAEPFRIPSGSMLPTLEVGDFLLVNKFAYGLRIPLINKKFIEIGEPDRGDIVVFKYPVDGKTPYIKRLIGRPGDNITYRNKHLYVNGEIVSMMTEDQYRAFGERFDRQVQRQTILRESGEQVEFNAILDVRRAKDLRAHSWTVPQGQYFVMGDNRDNSLDSRFWGFVPDENLIGRAFFIWLHYNPQDGGGFNFKRIGKSITASAVE